MNITKELIERFYKDQCNAQEAEMVVLYLNEHPGVIEDYMSEEEWGNYTNDLELNPAVSLRILLAIKKSTFNKIKRLHFFRYAAAASILLVLAIGIKYSSNNNIDKNKTVVKSAELETINIVKNDTKNTKKISLPDGSEVQLKPKSELSYMSTFEKNKRDVYLKGEAFFIVAKDKTKPFTVYSNAVATTALGTRFNVSSFENKNVVSIKLFEGKVVVKSADTVHKVLKNDLFLLPGDELIYYKINESVTIGSFKNDTSIAAIKKTIKQTGLTGDNWYMFNNQSLPKVFDQLQVMYHKKIIYSKADLENITFIGKLDKTDLLDDVLKSIALLNHLKIEKNTNGYIIRK